MLTDHHVRSICAIKLSIFLASIPFLVKSQLPLNYSRQKLCYRFFHKSNFSYTGNWTLVICLEGSMFWQCYSKLWIVGVLDLIRSQIASSDESDRFLRPKLKETLRRSDWSSRILKDRWTGPLLFHAYQLFVSNHEKIYGVGKCETYNMKECK